MELTKEQQAFVDAVTSDALNETKKVYILKGFAGTGKTVTVANVASKDVFKKVLVAAPTVKARNVLNMKLSSMITNKNFDYITIAKLLEVPSEEIEVMSSTYKLNESGMEDLKKLLDKMRISYDDYVTKKTFTVKNSRTGEFEDEIKYIINTFGLRGEFIKKFKQAGKDMVSEVTPSFNFKSDYEVTEKLSKYNLIIIDEMSMARQDSIKFFIDCWSKLNKYYLDNGSIYGQSIPTIVFAGDGGQLQPVKAEINDYFDKNFNIEEHDEVGYLGELNTILRSTDEIAKMAGLIRKNTEPKLAADISPQGLIFKGDLNKFIKAHPEKLATCDMAIAYKNDDVNTLNMAIRNIKGFNGDSVNVGERLLITENTPADEFGNVEYTNGETVIVKKIFSKDEAKGLFDEYDYKIVEKHIDEMDKELILLAIDKGNIDLIETESEDGSIKRCFIQHDMLNGYNNFNNIIYETLKAISKLVDGRCPMIKANFGYALTIHKSQGSEWKNVLIWVTSKNIWVLKKYDSKNWRSLVYTAYTRAAEVAQLIYADYF